MSANPDIAGKVFPLRAISFGNPDVAVERRDDGTIYLRPKMPLGDYPVRLTDRLHHWAALEPNRIFMAERSAGGWRTINYAQLLTSARHVASALLARGLSAEKPVVILSGNSIDHALIAFGALYAGIPFCPVSPAYSLVSKDYGKLAFLMKLLTPGLVFADDAGKFADALAANVPAATEIAASRGALPGRQVTMLADLLASPEHPRLDEIHDAIGPDTIAKFLLTSGSTGNPKAVINTQRMICANQVMLRETLAFLKDEPPVIVDWLPWNHTFGGNHNIGLTLYNGGSMYLDEGKPMPGGIEETVRNLREISPTVYFNVPKGYESLLPYLRDDASLRRKFFHRLHAMFFSGAALSPYVWNSLDELAVQETGFRVPMLTGLGATETAPFFMSVRPATSRSGHVGLPVSGNDAKLIPNNGKLEVRAKGPNITPGYWRQPELTAAAFDEEGFYKFGDALKPVDPDDFSAGFDFDGRIAEFVKPLLVERLRGQLRLAPIARRHVRPPGANFQFAVVRNQLRIVAQHGKPDMARTAGGRPHRHEIGRGFGGAETGQHRDAKAFFLHREFIKAIPDVRRQRRAREKHRLQPMEEFCAQRLVVAQVRQ